MKSPCSHTPLACPLCQDSTLTPTSLLCNDYITGDNFSLAVCQNCRCYVTCSETDQAQSKEYYGETYYNSRSGKFSPAIESIFHFNHVRNARFMHSHFPAARILEIGCGRAYILRELKRLGSEVYCLESSGAADWILSNKKLEVTSLEQDKRESWPFSSGFFQLIIYWHVLEHLPDPASSLAQTFRCLASGGILCISMPNISSLQARLGLKTWFHLDAPRHLFHFNQKSIVSFLETTGYRIVKVTAGDRIQNLFGWFQSVANLFTPWATNSLYRLLQRGVPLQTANTTALMVQIITSWIWIPLGVLGFILEEMSRNYGTITIYAKKIDNNPK